MSISLSLSQMISTNDCYYFIHETYRKDMFGEEERVPHHLDRTSPIPTDPVYQKSRSSPRRPSTGGQPNRRSPIPKDPTYGETKGSSFHTNVQIACRDNSLLCMWHAVVQKMCAARYRDPPLPFDFLCPYPNNTRAHIQSNT